MAFDGDYFDLAPSGSGTPVISVDGSYYELALVAPPPYAFGPRIEKLDDLLGIDIDVFDSLPSSFRLARGLKNLGNALARRLSTPKGFHRQAFDGDPNYGYDLLGRLNGSWRAEDIGAVEAEIEEQLRQDDRVLEASVTAKFIFAAQQLDVTAQIDTAIGPFQLVLRVRDVGIEVISAQQ